jgi:hypothetical protein
MLISSQQFKTLKRKNLVNYVYTFSDEESEERKLTTYSKGAAQPYISSLAGITFEIIIEDQDNPRMNTTQSVTINCSVVHNAAKPDFLLGTTFIASKGLIPIVENANDREKCSTLSRA